MKQLWEWKAIWPDGEPQEFQTEGPDVSEASMLEHLKGSYPNLNIIALRRADARECKPATGRVDRHAFQSGVWDEAMRELGLMPKARTTIADSFRKDRLLLAGVKRIPIRQRVSLIR